MKGTTLAEIDKELLRSLDRITKLQAARLQMLALSDLVEDWRPLQEAPYDGTWVEIREKRDFDGVDHRTIARWVDRDPPGVRRLVRNCGWETYNGFGFYCDNYLTWRPLDNAHPLLAKALSAKRRAAEKLK